MDDVARRREMRKRKILQNAENRIKKVTNVHSEATEQDHDLGKPSLKTVSVSPVNKPVSKGSSRISCAKNLECSFMSKSKVTSSKLPPPCQEKEHISNEASFQHAEGTKDADQTVGRSQTNTQEQTLPQTNAQDVETATRKGTNPKLRIIIVAVFATLCFYNSTYWPFIVQTTGLFKLGAKEQSFITPFCLLELFLLCIPSLRKVAPGNKANLWLLALKLCGVPQTVLDKVQLLILEILEFLTDLAVFIFVLVNLQSITAHKT